MEPEDRLPKRRLVLPADSSESPVVVQKEKSSSSSGAAYVAEEDTDALDCGVCFLPLKPPIFQCEVGHVVCSSCRDSLAAAGKCHVCGVATTGGYRRCLAMERLVESVRVPCPNAAHGCVARPAYYDQQCHRQTCAHAPCHCPGGEASCGFVGSTAALWDHISGVHGWPCATFVLPGRTRHRVRSGRIELWVPIPDAFFDVRLHDGFNFVLVLHSTDEGATASAAKYLFLLNVVRQPVGRTVSVHWIHPEAAASSDDNDGEATKRRRQDEHARTFAYEHFDWELLRFWPPA